jgi:hypothetical protein
MKPARSLAASVVALGFAGSVAGPLPAFGAPAPCERALSYASQSGAELLRIDRLEVRKGGGERPIAKDPAPPKRTANRLLDGDTDPTSESPDDNDTLSEGIGTVGKDLINSFLPKNNPLLPRAAPDESGGVGTDAAPAVADAGSGSDSGPRADAGGEGGGSVVGSDAGDDSDAGGDSAAGDSAAGDSEGGDDSAAGDDAAAGGSDADGGGSASRGGVRTAQLSDVGLGEARTAMVGTSKVKSAAVARVLDGQAGGKSSWSRPILQQAPPTNAHPATRSTPAGQAGPLKIGSGELSGQARWDAGMACAATAGETARASSAVDSASILGGAESALVRVPEKAAGVSTTALDGTAERARSVASATITAGRVDLVGGRVRLRVLKAPSLVASMGLDGGDVRYQPAVVEISGDGIKTKRLDAAGESADITLRGTESGVLDAAGLGDLRPASHPLPLPHVPGLPTVNAPSPVTESAAASGTRLHIELGGARRATKGHAIAARAVAITVSVTQGEAASEGRGKSGYGGQSSASASVDLAIGLLEAAAVAPMRVTPAADTSGTGGGLPITGPGVAGLAMGGMALLLSGAAAVVFGKRRRRSHF